MLHVARAVRGLCLLVPIRYLGLGDHNLRDGDWVKSLPADWQTYNFEWANEKPRVAKPRPHRYDLRAAKGFYKKVPAKKSGRQMAPDRLTEPPLYNDVQLVPWGWRPYQMAKRVQEGERKSSPGQQTKESWPQSCGARGPSGPEVMPILPKVL